MPMIHNLSRTFCLRFLTSLRPFSSHDDILRAFDHPFLLYLLHQRISNLHFLAMIDTKHQWIHRAFHWILFTNMLTSFFIIINTRLLSPSDRLCLSIETGLDIIDLSILWCALTEDSHIAIIYIFECHCVWFRSLTRNSGCGFSWSLYHFLALLSRSWSSSRGSRAVRRLLLELLPLKGLLTSKCSVRANYPRYPFSLLQYQLLLIVALSHVKNLFWRAKTSKTLNNRSRRFFFFWLLWRISCIYQLIRTELSVRSDK